MLALSSAGLFERCRRRATLDGIVGKIREVFPHSAQVLVINDQSSGAGVILETTRIRGILRGNAEGQPQIVGILSDQRIKRDEERAIPPAFDYAKLSGLSREMVEKLSRVRPATLGQASRMAGVTPAAVALIQCHLEMGTQAAA